MTRHKLKIAYLENVTSRKVTFNKRKQSLLKKVRELSTMCGVEACAIVYSEDKPEPDVWPSPAEAKRILEKATQVPDFHYRMENQESIMQDKLQKAEELLSVLKQENRKKFMTLEMFKCLSGERSIDDLSLSERKEIIALIDEKVNAAVSRIKDLEEKKDVPVDGTDLEKNVTKDEHKPFFQDLNDLPADED